MKKIIANILTLVFLFGFASLSASGQMTGMKTPSDDHTAREEAEGKAVWEKLQAKTVGCDNLSDEDFGVLGEYFMSQMTGIAHAAMNAMMTQMMGEEGEEAMHVALGKRLSSCDPNAAFPTAGGGFMPMMNMMGGWLTPFGSNSTNNGWFFMILWWVLIIAGIVALIKWVAGQTRGGISGKSALDILKERYARGEIDKREFEAKRKDILD